MKFVLAIALFSVIFFLLVLVFLYTRQEKMIFLSEKLPRQFVFNFPGEYEERFFKPESGISIHALHFRNPNPKGVLFYFHGNAGSMASWGQWAQLFLDYNYDVVMYDYRGYGKSSGMIKDEQSIHSDAEYIYQRIIPEYADKQVIFYGRSLGTGIAASLATRYQPDQLVLVTPYFNFEDVVSHHYPYVPVTILLKYKFTTDAFLPGLECPIYLIHGTEDEVIPYESSVKLADLGDHIELTTIPGATHMDLPDFPVFREALEQIFGKEEDKQEE
ncbi:alpha/beta fold hydrolase [bacterium SCSIO 12741]|nr:alpha/beta fold hydrolase [bacterium SCSIO 12741]